MADIFQKLTAGSLILQTFLPFVEQTHRFCWDSSNWLLPWWWATSAFRNAPLWLLHSVTNPVLIVHRLAEMALYNAWGWCTGKTQRDGTGREVGGGFRMGNTCIPVADSCLYITKPIRYCKVKKKKSKSPAENWGRICSFVASLVAQMVKNLPAMWETWVWSLGWEIPGRRVWQPTPVFLPGEFHGQRSLVGYSPRGCKESDTTERLTPIHTVHFIGKDPDLS